MANTPLEGVDHFLCTRLVSSDHLELSAQPLSLTASYPAPVCQPSASVSRINNNVHDKYLSGPCGFLPFGQLKSLLQTCKSAAAIPGCIELHDSNLRPY